MKGGGPAPVLAAPAQPRARSRLVEFMVAFACVFGALAVPSPGLGPLYVRAHAALGNAVLPSSLASQVRLSFQATPAQLSDNPWQTTLVVEPPRPKAPLSIPIDMRSLAFLPTAAFVGLSLAAPLKLRENLRLLATGLLLLEPLLLALIALPIVSFLGGTGPVRAFEIGTSGHVVLQVLYRAFVAPPGMAYAVPLILWWVLLRRSRQGTSPLSLGHPHAPVPK